MMAGLTSLACAEDLVLPWNEIPRTMVENRNVDLSLADGSTVHGQALAVTPTGLHMRIDRAGRNSGRSVGEADVPAAEITMMKVDRSGTRGRAVGTLIGCGITVVAIVGIVGVTQNEGTRASAGVIVAAIAPVPVGYLLGWGRDHHRTTIHIRRQ